MNGALLIDKNDGVSSFGIIELLQKQLIEKKGISRKSLPKLGHGGTLDPFATGLLIVLVGKGVKLARYFLGSHKTYEGLIRFGETTIPGDLTAPISDRSTSVPESIETLRELAHRLTLQPYLQTPPMHSAKKKNGKPLYQFAREGIEIEREPKVCHLYQFEIKTLHKNFPTPDSPFTTVDSEFELVCGSGTYVRTLSQDFGKLLGTVAYLRTLRRTASGVFHAKNAWKVQEILDSTSSWDQLPCWVPFDQLPDGFGERFDRAEATVDEGQALIQGKQAVLSSILPRSQSTSLSSREKKEYLAIYCKNSLLAIAHKDANGWGIERVFT